jgi:hypothetical protein
VTDPPGAQASGYFEVQGLAPPPNGALLIEAGRNGFWPF